MAGHHKTGALNGLIWIKGTGNDRAKRPNLIDDKVMREKYQADD